jgi:hypothetical protein
VPTIAAAKVVNDATSRLRRSAASTASLCSAEPYQKSVKPFQTAWLFDALNEKRMSATIGA